MPKFVLNKLSAVFFMCMEVKNLTFFFTVWYYGPFEQLMGPHCQTLIHSFSKNANAQGLAKRWWGEGAWGILWN